MCDVLHGSKEEGKLEGNIESLYCDSEITPEKIAIKVERLVAFVKEILFP